MQSEPRLSSAISEKDTWPEMHKAKLDVFIGRLLLAGLFVFVAALPFSIALCQIGLGLAYIAWIGQMLRRRRFGVSPTPLDYFFLAYLVVEIISLIFSQDRWTSLIYFRRMLLIPIVYLVAQHIVSERHAKILVATLIGVMMLVGLWGIQKYLAGVGGLLGRLSLRQHYMTSGGLVMMVATFCVAYALSSAPRSFRWLAWLAAIPLVAALVFTFTRSAWLGFLGSLVTIGIIVNRKLIIAILLAVAVLLAVGPSSLRNRALSIVDPTHPLNIERIYMWQTGIAIVKAYPWTGVGDINLSEIYRQYKPPEAKEVAGHLHNNFLTLGATLGIPGLLVTIALFVKIFIMEIGIVQSTARESWFIKSTALASLAGFIGFQINGFFEWNFGDAEIAMLLWFTVGLALAMDRLAKATSSV
ncbi:MAG: O-antigen ligase family protein, partial [candidate division KSB1 bacterium]|nr:O-antigen ligase family protein [candidate division KSB1 bacterium]